MTLRETPNADELERWTESIDDALRAGDDRGVARLVAGLHLAALADVLESLPPEQRLRLWRHVTTPASQGELLVEVRGEVRDWLIQRAEPAELAAAVAELQLDELADLYERLPERVQGAVLRVMDPGQRQRFARVLAWPHDSAGGLMDADALTVREDVTLAAAQRFLRRVRRREGRLPEHTALLVVVDRTGVYRGVLALADLASLPPDRTVGVVMDRAFEAIPATLSARRVARLFEDRDLIAAPVVDDDGRLIGRITVDDVVDVIRDEAERSLMQPAGVDREADMFAPVWRTARRRGLWLAVNLMNAFVAAWVIGRFGATIEQRVALAALMPIVASMGGVAGIQTLTVVTRGIALDQVGRANVLRLLGHELAVGLVSGTALAVVLGGLVFAWFGDPGLGGVFGAAVIINLVNGALAGTLVPVGLERLGVDPALAGGVALTALTDIVGFGVFLGLAASVLL